MKSCGEWFELIVDREQHAALLEAARMSTAIEVALWQEWARNDPEFGVRFVERISEKESTGKWPKLTPYNLKQCASGVSPDIAARRAFPALHGDIASQVANHVRRLYPQKDVRLQILSGRKSIPTTNNLFIRFRNRIARIAREPKEGVEWFRFALPLKRGGEPLSFGMKLKGASEFTIRHLGDLADNGKHPSCGTISLVRRGRKWVWRMSISRERFDGEREALKKPRRGRKMIVYAPTEQERFIVCRIVDECRTRGAPWEFAIEEGDLLAVKRRNDARRREMGHAFRQSPTGSRRGRGVYHRLDPSMRMTRSYDNRANSWIEQRSAYIAQSAVKYRCESVAVEDFTKRDPASLRMGSFPYHRFVLRILQKCEERGVKARKIPSFSDVETMLGTENKEVAAQPV